MSTSSTDTQGTLSLDFSPTGAGIEYVSHSAYPVSEIALPPPSKAPTAAFIDSVRATGAILCPIVAIRIGGKLLVKDGLRRLQAALVLKLPTVPLLEVKLDSLHGAVLGLMLNTARSENPVAELRMIVELLTAGATEQQISEATHMPIARIRERLRLQQLNKELFALADRGAIGVSVAQAAAKLTKDEQKKVLRQYRKGETLTLGDVQAVRKAGATKIANSIPAELLAVPTTAVPAWQANVRKLLGDARAQVPAGTDSEKLAKAVDAALALAS
jgi:ParB-like chromosome segregation protein Spo0J